jgi:vitamin B12 transporter
MALDLLGRNLSDRLTMEYKIYAQRYNYEYHSDNNNTSTTTLYKTDIYGGDLATSYQIAAHQLLGGLQLQMEQLSRNDTADTWRNGALFLQDSWEISQQWQLVSGVRWDTGSVYSSPVSPRFGLNYAVSDQFTIKLGYGKAFRAPNFDELYYPESSSTYGTNTYCYEGNPDLKPEISNRYDLTGEWRNGAQTVSLNCFTAKVSNGISWKKTTTYTTDTGTTYIYNPVNIAKMQIKGGSLSWRDQLTQAFSVGVKYTRTDRRSWSDTTQSYSGDENDYGKNRYTLALDYRRGAWLTNLDWNRVTERNDDQADYVVLDWNLKYQMNAGLYYALTIDNLTDKAYEVEKRYPMSGREYYLSVNYTF